MRRGCIAVNIFRCDICGNNIEHGERYLVMGGNSEGPEKRICISCCLEKKYAKYVVEKGEKVLTFLIDEPLPKTEDIKKPEAVKTPEAVKKPEIVKKTEIVKKPEAVKKTEAAKKSAVTKKAEESKAKKKVPTKK